MIARARVLVVEEHPQDRFALVEQLRLLGVVPVPLQSGQDALRDVARHVSALILIDCDLSGMDGYETARRIRQLEAELASPRTPIIALSADFDSASLERCLDNGMDSMLKKLPSTETLRSLLGVWLDHAVPRAAEHRPDIDANNIHALSRISIGEDLLAFEQAMEQHNSEEMTHFAHRLKGVALALGASAAAGTADRLERAIRDDASPEPVLLRATLRALKDAFDSHLEYGSGATDARDEH
jgi:two-component system sensor histidine kinase EvgS